MSNPKPVILLAFANDRDDTIGYLRNLPVEARRLREVLERAEQADLCEVVVRSGCTATDLFKVFQDPRYRNRIAIFHYGGHANGYQLLLESAAGQATAALAGGLAAFLAQQQGLQLVFLNGCSTEQQTEALLEANISAVIATSGAIDDQVATDFSYHFYQGLAGGSTIRTAFREAAASVQTTTGGNTRALYFHSKNQVRSQPEVDRWPWNLYLREGSEKADQWNLPEAANDPLFGLPPLVDQDLPESPYRHLNWFTRKDAEVFFGRGRQIRELYDRLTASRTPPIILFYGQSGVGKSSVLDAGLIPRLERDYEVMYLRRGERGLLGALQVAFLPEAVDAPIEKAWRAKEDQLNKTLIVFLDQVEEVFTRPLADMPNELNQFLVVLKAIFCDASCRPKGKLVLGFRKEWLAELEAKMMSDELPRTKVFLEPLDRLGVIEVVHGPTRATRLRSQYGLTVEDGLAEIIADDLLSDNESAIAPTLQILLTKMWAEAKQASYEQPQFGQDLYQHLKRRGILLRDFLTQQIAAFRQLQPEAVDSGLLLDIITLHTTPLGTADQRSVEELHRLYAHSASSLPTILQQCQDLHLLTVAASTPTNNVKTTRLVHDTLAPIVREQFDQSDKPGQRARRILDNRSVDWKDGRTGTPLDDMDLSLVEQGELGTRIWNETEKRLIDASRNLRAKLQAEELAREHERRKRERAQVVIWRNLTVAATVVLMVVTGLGLYAWKATQKAERELRGSEARRLVGESLSARRQYPERALLLACQAAEATAADGYYFSSAEQALRNALSDMSGRKIEGTLRAVSNDRNRFVTSTGNALYIHQFGLESQVSEPIVSPTNERFSQVLLGDKWLVAIDAANNGTIWDSYSNKKQPEAFTALRLLGLGSEWILTEATDNEYHLMHISSDKLQPVTELKSCQFANNKTCLGGIDKDGAFQIWNLETLTKTDVDGNYKSSRVLAISSSGRSALLEESSDRDYRYWLYSLKGTAATRTELVGEKAPVAGASIFRIRSARFDAAEEKLVADLIDPQKGDGLVEVFGRWAVWDLANIEAGSSPRPSEEIVDDWAIQRESSQIICQNTRTPSATLEVNIKLADKLLAVSKNAEWIVTSLDNELFVHSVYANGESESVSLVGHETRPNTAAISADNAWLVSSDDMCSRIWPLTLDRLDTEPIRVNNLPSGIRGALTSEDESKFFAVLDDNPVEYKIPYQRRPESRVLKESCKTLRSLSISKLGNRLAAVSGYLYPPVVYDLDRLDNNTIYPLGMEPIDAVRGIDFSEDGNWMTVSTFSLGAGLWRFDEGRREFVPIEFAGLEQAQQNLYRYNQRILLLPNPKYLLTADEKYSPHLWRLDNRAEPCDNDLPSEMKRATFVTRIPNSTWVILRTNDGKLLLWDAQTPNKVNTLNIPTNYIPTEFSNRNESEEDYDQCQISPNGQWIVLHGSDTSIRLISVQNPKLTKLLAEGIKAQLRTWFSPDSRSLIVANKDLQLWKLTPTAILSPASLGPADFNISHAAFTSSGRELITGSTTGLVQLYDLTDTNFSPIELQAHRGPIQAIKLIAGESRIVGISSGSTMISRLWKQDNDKVKRLSDLIELSKVFIGEKQVHVDE